MKNKQIAGDNWCPLMRDTCSQNCMFWVNSGCHILRAIDNIILLADAAQQKVFAEIKEKHGQKKAW